MLYMCRKDTCIFMPVGCIRMVQLSSRLIWQYCKHNFTFMCSSGPCQQNFLHNYIAVNGGGRKFGIRRRDTRIEIHVNRTYGKIQEMMQRYSDGLKHSSIPRLLTNESSILTHILILRQTSSKLHIVKSHNHYQSLLQYRLK